MSQRQLEKIVEQVIARLPATFREHLENVAILWAEEPPEGQGPNVVGLYEGVPLTQQRAADYLSCITLFWGSFLRACHTPEELEREVKRVLLHEIGHHFGLREAELERIEEVKYVSGR